MKKGASETILSYSSHSYTNGDAVLNKKKNGFVFFFIKKKEKEHEFKRCTSKYTGCKFVICINRFLLGIRPRTGRKTNT